MAVITLTRVTVDPANAAELVVAHAAAVKSQRASGLVAAQLGKLDGSTWIALWHWESHERLTAARGRPPVEAAVAFALTSGATVDDVDVVDEL